MSYRLIDHEPEGRTDKVSAMRGRHSVAEARLPLLGTFRTRIDVRLESAMRFKADIGGINIATNSTRKFQYLVDRLFLESAGLSISVYRI